MKKRSLQIILATVLVYIGISFSSSVYADYYQMLNWNDPSPGGEYLKDGSSISYIYFNKFNNLKFDGIQLNNNTLRLNIYAAKFDDRVKILSTLGGSCAFTVSEISVYKVKAYDDNGYLGETAFQYMESWNDFDRKMNLNVLLSRPVSGDLKVTIEFSWTGYIQDDYDDGSNRTTGWMSGYTCTPQIVLQKSQAYDARITNKIIDEIPMNDNFNFSGREFTEVNYTAPELETGGFYVLSPTGNLNYVAYKKDTKILTVNELYNQGTQSKRNYSLGEFLDKSYKVLHIYHVPNSTDVVMAFEQQKTVNNKDYSTVYSIVMKWNLAINEYYLDLSTKKSVYQGSGEFSVVSKYGIELFPSSGSSWETRLYRVGSTGYSHYMTIYPQFLWYYLGEHAYWFRSLFDSTETAYPSWYPEVTEIEKQELEGPFKYSTVPRKEATGAMMAVKRYTGNNSGGRTYTRTEMMYHSRRSGEYIYTNEHGKAVYDTVMVDRGINLDPYNYNEYPNFTIFAPALNQVVGGNSIFSPSIAVSDINGNTLTCKYYLDNESEPEDIKYISNTKSTQTVNFNAINMLQLAEGEHSITFEVGDGIYDPIKQSINVRVDKSGPVTTVNYLQSTENGLTISVNSVDALSELDASPFKFSIGSQQSGWIKDANYSFASLAPNSPYTVVVEARDQIGNIGRMEQSIYTKAQTPVISAVNSTESSLDLSVSDGNPSNTQYQVVVGGMYINQYGSLTSTPTWVALSSKKITAYGLYQNTMYAISAKARNNENIETVSSAQAYGVTLPIAPDKITCTPSQNHITLSWEPYAGSVSYDVEADGVMISNITSPTYTHTGLYAGTSHTYKVRVRNAGGPGNWSSVVTAQTLMSPPDQPTNLHVEDISQTYITLSWNPSTRAASYDIEDNGTVIGSSTTNSYAHQNLSPNTKHTYRVRARNAGGESAWSEAMMESTYPNPPQTPYSITSTVSKDSIHLMWSGVAGATEYEVEADTVLISTNNNTSYLHDSLLPLTPHTYRVRAVNRGGKSPWSAPVYITTNPDKPVTPTNIMATSDKYSATITWYKVPYAESYDIEIDGTQVRTTADMSYVNLALSPDTEHTYRVRANNVSGCSEWSNPVTVRTLPEASGSNMSLTNIVAVVTNNFITLSWDTVARDAEYYIEVDNDLLDIGKETQYNHTGLNASEFHTYKVRIKKEGSDNSWCAVLSLSTLPNPPDAPDGMEATASDNSIELRWSKVGDDVTYDVEVDGQVIDNGYGDTYIHSGLDSGTSHTYRVRARNITGVTAWSTVLTKSTTSPSYLVNAVKDTEFDLSLIASNVQDFSGLTFVITYNPDELDVVDLCGFTPDNDTAAQGNIKGTNLYVSYTSGRIEFTVKENIIPGTSWSGEITNILLKAKVSGESKIDIKVVQTH